MKSQPVLSLLLGFALASEAGAETARLSIEELKDKIAGGWAGQTIGVTFGGPTEFRYNGTMIQPYEPIPWYDGYLLETFQKIPGLYDDIYMDLTFVEVLEEKGLDAKASDFAEAFAHRDYLLWHANQMARYNVLQGKAPPASGHWRNNPEADSIDFQIEADFAGLMSPGMPNGAAEISDRVGHVMNYGDGFYGGVYVAAMYALAFVTDDVEQVVVTALETIPPESTFRQTIEDVIRWHRQYPDDWRETWFEIEKKWSEDIGSPIGVFRAFNIDAKLNAAYVVMGLLYGDGDFGKTSRSRRAPARTPTATPLRPRVSSESFWDTRRSRRAFRRASRRSSPSSSPIPGLRSARCTTSPIGTRSSRSSAAEDESASVRSRFQWKSRRRCPWSATSRGTSRSKRSCSAARCERRRLSPSKASGSPPRAKRAPRTGRTTCWRRSYTSTARSSRASNFPPTPPRGASFPSIATSSGPGATKLAFG